MSTFFGRANLLSIALGTLVFGLLSATALESSSWATLRRLPRTWFFGPQPVWTLGTTSTVFHPMSEPMESAGLLEVRAAYELSQDSGDCELRPALRYSDDGVSWDASKPIHTAYQNGNGTIPATVYVDITQLATTVRSFVQFGVEAKNGSAGAIQMCSATIRVEPKEVR